MSVTLLTDLGPIKIELYCDEAPKACENFLALCASGAYNNTLIHRNVKGFIVQMGDPTGSGKGGKSIWGEPFEDEISPELRHSKRGVLSMANSGPNTNLSQFFITYDKHPSLDGKYTIFGYVIYGANSTLDAIEDEPVGKKHRPVKDIRIQQVTIHANPFA